VLARPCRLTGRPRLSAAVLPRARPPSLARCPVGPTCRRQFPSPVRSLSLSHRPSSPVPSRCPPRIPFSLSASWACLVSYAFPALAVDWRVRTRARRRVSRPRCPPTRPAPFFRAPPMPRTHPSPHSAQLRRLSRSAHAASCRRRPASGFPAIQLAKDRPRPHRTPPRGETPVPVPNFPYCALCLSNFSFAGARLRRSAVLARWPADLARSSSPE
jgi:hypothetical protein